MKQVEHLTARMSDGVTLHVVAAGPSEGPRLILLHGFPDSWRVWRHQLPALAAAGFRVIVPDLRGYGGSDAPPAVRAYRLDRLAADVLALADHARFDLVGHDWGGIVAWAVAARHPDQVRRLSILNAPHLDVVPGVMRRDPRQLLRSAYVGFFQLPAIAEALLRARGFALLKRMVRAVARRDTFPPEAIAANAADWSRPGRLTAMLNYYRALVRCRRAPLGDVSVPTSILWGRRDGALGPALAEASLTRCDDGRLTWFADAAHWPQLDAPAAVTDALVGWHGEGRHAH